MPKKKSSRARPSECREPGQIAKAGGQTLRSYMVGAMPIVNRLLERMKLDEFFEEYLPPDRANTRLPTRTGLLLLVNNFLFSREPVYGVGEWADLYAPDLVGVRPAQRRYLNDDRLGRCLDVLFLADQPDLVLALVRHVIREFSLRLEELHNDSTTFSFFGAYRDAAEEGFQRGRRTPAITYGHSKARRPDLKQLLCVLTVTEDGGVPVYFTTKSGNVTDDKTHQETWELLCELVGRRDFLYVADCKLATIENMRYIDQRRGRFISVLQFAAQHFSLSRTATVTSSIGSGARLVDGDPDDRCTGLDRIVHKFRDRCCGGTVPSVPSRKDESLFVNDWGSTLLCHVRLFFLGKNREGPGKTALYLRFWQNGSRSRTMLYEFLSVPAFREAPVHSAVSIQSGRSLG